MRSYTIISCMLIVIGLLFVLSRVGPYIYKRRSDTTVHSNTANSTSNSSSSTTIHGLNMLKSRSTMQHDASYDSTAYDWVFKFELVHTPIEEFLHEAQVNKQYLLEKYCIYIYSVC
jgi:hypothetical protein